jgi:hypothetical protein
MAPIVLPPHAAATSIPYEIITFSNAFHGEGEAELDERDEGNLYVHIESFSYKQRSYNTFKTVRFLH